DAEEALEARREELAGLISEQSELEAALHRTGGDAPAGGEGAEQGGGPGDDPDHGSDGAAEDGPHPEGSGADQPGDPAPEGGSGGGAGTGAPQGTGGTAPEDGAPEAPATGSVEPTAAPAPGSGSGSGDGPCSAAPAAAAQRSNGRIPASELCSLPQPGEALRADAAAAFIRLDGAYRERFGHPMCVTDSYRPIDEQVRLFAEKEPGMAADPGTSTHGLGIAVDLCGGVEREDSAEHRWMLANAAEHGWHNPPWARGGFEPWHWEFQPGSG